MGNETNVMTRTTVAITTLEGSPGANVLAATARANANIRVAVGRPSRDGGAAAADHPGPKVELRVVEGNDPSPVSPCSGRNGSCWRTAITAVFPEALVTPYIMMGGTDSRRFTGICGAVYRFAPFSMDTEARASIHAVDEKILLETWTRGVTFYETLIRELSEADVPLRWHHDWDGHLPADRGPRRPDRRCPGARSPRRWLGLQQRRQGHARLDGGQQSRRERGGVGIRRDAVRGQPDAGRVARVHRLRPSPGFDGGGLEGLHRPGEDRQFRAPAGMDRAVVDPGAGHPARRRSRSRSRTPTAATSPPCRPASGPSRPRPARTRPPKPYVVVSSVPVDLPHRGGDGTIDPRVVFRVIQGYKYFGSYGITNIVGGTEGKSLRAAEPGPRPRGHGGLLLRGPDGAEGVRPGPRRSPRPRPSTPWTRRPNTSTTARNSPTSSGC